jgi:hypothetical protein
VLNLPWNMNDKTQQETTHHDYLPSNIIHPQHHPPPPANHRQQCRLSLLKTQFARQDETVDLIDFMDAAGSLFDVDKEGDTTDKVLPPINLFLTVLLL